jgi:hypothetical protein
MTLQEYASLHPEEYAQKAAEANESGKTLVIKGKKLLLIDIETSIEELKTAKKAEINRAKEREEYANISYLGTEFQADADSQFKLSSAVLMAQASRVPSFEWYDAYNSKKLLSAAQLKELGFILMFRTATLVGKAREIKDALQRAESKEEIEGIKWE